MSKLKATTSGRFLCENMRMFLITGRMIYKLWIFNYELSAFDIKPNQPNELLAFTRD